MNTTNMITLEDIKLAFLVYVQAGTLFHHRVFSTPLSPETKDALTYINGDCLVKGFIKGLLAYKENSHNILNSPNMDIAGPMFDCMFNKLMVSYAKCVDDDPETDLAKLFNRAAGYAFQEQEAHTLEHLAEINSVLFSGV